MSKFVAALVIVLGLFTYWQISKKEKTEPPVVRDGSEGVRHETAPKTPPTAPVTTTLRPPGVVPAPGALSGTAGQTMPPPNPPPQNPPPQNPPPQNPFGEQRRKFQKELREFAARIGRPEFVDVYRQIEEARTNIMGQYLIIQPGVPGPMKPPSPENLQAMAQAMREAEGSIEEYLGPADYEAFKTLRQKYQPTPPRP
jgi:hypothetical protein